VDQLQEKAIEINHFVDNTLGGMIHQLEKVLRNIWNEIRPTFEEIVKGIRVAFASVVEYFEETTIPDPPKGDVYRWQKIRHKQIAEDRLKKRSKQRINHIWIWGWHKFKRSRHRGS
jgi:hypothetical protein